MGNNKVWHTFHSDIVSVIHFYLSFFGMFYDGECKKIGWRMLMK